MRERELLEAKEWPHLSTDAPALIMEASLLSQGCPADLDVPESLQSKVLRLGTRTLNNVCSSIIRPVSDGPDDDERAGLRLGAARPGGPEQN